MAKCPACGHGNRERAKFCEECGAPIGASTRGAGEERKVVTSLFCDLVGFTAASESADPEDVDRMLAAYFAMARIQIETYGGVVQKFIGDAVVGIFGVPAAHEDDPERAVYAGLRIVEDAHDLTTVSGEPLRLRVGINTGEALVRLGVAPGSGGGFLAGDAINTASRIQTVAPEMGVAAGLTTYQATRSIFEYTELEPASLKGKSEPVRIFHAIAPRARTGPDLKRIHDAPFVGREIEFALLKSRFEAAVRSAVPHFVTIVGEPGIGKSRLVGELAADIDRRPDLIVWRQGRCLPYGEGITFWALGEILKAHAGILESDALPAALAKLDDVLPSGPERLWLRQRLLPLLGMEPESTPERSELFAAWRRFLEHIATQHPTVLVFEDLHWADPAMLEFIVDLAARAEAGPLFLLTTTRPDLFERHPEYAGQLHNATTISLVPLSDPEIAHMAADMLATTEIPPELEKPIVERAGGNPLYAEELVRLLKDRDLLIKQGSSWTLAAGAVVPFPESIQALIAARLDSLPAEHKAILADAAVIGSVFWTTAVAAVGNRSEHEIAEAMRELAAKELVRPARRSSMLGDSEYSFWHVLARDVAYAQLPRASRAARHVAAAAWIESRAPDRVGDLADILAYHYETALELSRATGQPDGKLEEAALRFLTLAGERALGLDTSAAMTSLERALALAPAGHPERPVILALFGEAAMQAARLTEAAEALEESTASFLAAGNVSAAARAMVTLGLVYGILGDPRKWTLPQHAATLLQPLGPTPQLVAALIDVAGIDASMGRSSEGIRVADQAIAMAEQLELPRPARALGFRGFARVNLGDRGGLDDYREAIELATRAGQGREVALLHNNLGIDLGRFEGPGASLQVLRDGIEFSRSRGLTEMLDSLTDSILGTLFDTGDHDELLEIAADLASRLEGSGDVFDLIGIREAQVRVMALRGEGPTVLDMCDWLQASARTTGDPQHVVLGLGSSAYVLAAAGRSNVAIALLSEIAGSPETREGLNYPPYLAMMVRTALEFGDRALAERLVDGLDGSTPYAEHALAAANAALTEDRGDVGSAATQYADAADRWKQMGVVPEEAFALLGEGRCLVRSGRHTDATPRLNASREIFERLHARPALAVIDSLGMSGSASSSG